MITKTVLCALISLSLPVFSNANEFQRRHPRRAEVNDRVQNQRARISAGVRSGKLTKDQAKELRTDLREIKKQEVQDVKANGGYLTKEQKQELNHQLNESSKEIYQEKHPAPAPN